MTNDIIYYNMSYIILIHYIKIGMYKPDFKPTLFSSTIASLCVHQLPLELFQSFVKNIDGSYSRFRCPDPLPETELPEGHRTDRPQAIRPMELRTFLRVGESNLFIPTARTKLQNQGDQVFVTVAHPLSHHSNMFRTSNHKKYLHHFFLL